LYKHSLQCPSIRYDVRFDQTILGDLSAMTQEVTLLVRRAAFRMLRDVMQRQRGAHSHRCGNR